MRSQSYSSPVRRTGSAVNRGRKPANPLDETSYSGVDDITIDLEKDIPDVKVLFKELVKCNIKMFNELSQQIVEFDNERKAADKRAHEDREALEKDMVSQIRAMMDSVQAMEQEVLENQKHQQVMEAITAVHEMARDPDYTTVLRAIDGQEMPDIAPILAEVGMMKNTHRDIHEAVQGAHGEVLEAIGSIEQTDLGPVLAETRLMHDNHGKLYEAVAILQESHDSLHSRHGEHNDMLRDLLGSHNGLHDKHEQLLEAIGGIELAPTDMSPVLAEFDVVKDSHGKTLDMLVKLHDGHAALHDKHEKVLSALGQLQMPDMRPLHKHIGDMGSFMNDHGSKMSQLDRRLAALEKNSQDQKRALDTLLQRLPEGLDRQLKAVQADIKTVRSAVQEDLGSLGRTHLDAVKDLRKDMQGMSSETSKTSQDLKKLHQAHADGLKQITSAHKQHASDMLAATRQIKGGPDLNSIVDGVHNKLSRTTLKTDLSQVSQHLALLPELHAKMGDVHGKMGDVHGKMGDMHGKISGSNIHYDPNAILKAIEKIKPGPTHDMIAQAVHDKLSKTQLKVDHSEMLKAINGLGLDSGLDQHHADLHSKLSKHTSDIMKALSGLPTHDHIGEVVRDVLANHYVNVDHSELKQLLGDIPKEHDHDTMAEAVHSRITGALHSKSSEQHDRVLDAISSLNLNPDLTIVLDAVQAMEDNVLQKVLDAIGNIQVGISVHGAPQSELSVGSTLRQAESTPRRPARQAYTPAAR